MVPPSPPCPHSPSSLPAEPTPTEAFAQLDRALRNSGAGDSACGNGQAENGSEAKGKKERIRQAAAFLESPGILDGPSSGIEKTQFLQRKGLSDDEIKEAMSRVATTSTPQTPGADVWSKIDLNTVPHHVNSQIQPRNHPVLPPRPPHAVMIHHQLAHLQSQMQTRRQLWQNFALFFVVFFAALGGSIILFRNTISAYLDRLRTAFQAYQRERNSLTLDLIANILNFLKLYSSNDDDHDDDKAVDESNPVKLPDALKQYIQDTTTTLEKFQQTHLPFPLISNTTSSPLSPLADLKQELDGFSQEITSSLYSYPSYTHGSFTPSQTLPPSVLSASSEPDLTSMMLQLKSDIRALKGSLLSRKNFPVATPTMSELPFIGKTNGTTSSIDESLGESVAAASVEDGGSDGYAS